MRSMSRVVVGAIAMAFLSGTALGTEYKLQPISANGSHQIVNNEIRLFGANQRVFLEVQLRGWAPKTARTYQAKIAANGYSSGAVGTIGPAFHNCPGRTGPGNQACALALGAGSRCDVPPSPAPATSCTAGFINTFHANWVFKDTCGVDPCVVNTAVVDISSPSYRYAGVLEGCPCAQDNGTFKYGGTLVLDVPPGAAGTFTIGFETAFTYVAEENGDQVEPLTTTPAVIKILCASNPDCNDLNLCTTDSCNVQTGVCTNSPNYNTTAECCNPSTGGLTTLSDGIQCTDDVCDTATGEVTHPNSPEFTDCGNPANSQCDGPDSCDGNGACNPRIQPDGTACGNGDDTECDNPDTCDGAGDCQDNYEANGFACGSSSDTNCDNADTCNGVGVCLTNNEPNGTPCSDGLFCNVGERCDNAVCTGGTPRDCADLLTCTNDSCNEDTDACDNIRQANTCLIAGVCYLPGEQRPTNTCEECNPAQNGTGWSTRPDGSPCIDGDACTGTGRPGIDPDQCTGGTCAGEVDPECNADCEFAVPVIVGPNTSNNLSGGPDDGEASCQPDSNNDVWFKYTANCEGATFLSTTGSALAPSNDTVLTVYTGCPPPDGTGTEIDCDDDSGAGLQSALVFPTALGTTYWIRVAGFENNVGNILLNVRPVDDCLIDNVCYADGDLNPENDCLACIPEISTTEWSERPEGSSCGNLQDTDCDSPDACDGDGHCEVNYKPDNTLCSDEAGGNVCTFNLCDDGACTHPPVPVGVPCGDTTDRQCDGPDQCNGGGACDPNYKLAGVACGDQSDTQCDDPNFCDGLGGCLENHAVDGIPCDDASVCTGGDACDTGDCVGDGTIPAPVVEAIGSRRLRITPQSGTYNLPVYLRVTSPTWSCLFDYVTAFDRLGDFNVARFATPSQWGGVVVIDPDVFPTSEYHVVGVCPPYVSPPGIDSTGKYGDVNDDDVVDAVDIAHIVNAYKHLPGALATEFVDIWPCVVDDFIDALDIAADVNAFKGFPYPCSPPCHP